MQCLPESVLEHETVNSLHCHFSDTDGDVVFILLLAIDHFWLVVGVRGDGSQSRQRSQYHLESLCP